MHGTQITAPLTTGELCLIDPRVGAEDATGGCHRRGGADFAGDTGNGISQFVCKLSWVGGIEVQAAAIVGRMPHIV